MAFLFQDPNEEEEQKKAAAGGDAGAGAASPETAPPMTGTGSSLLGGGSGGPSPAPLPGQAQGPTSSGWTNLRAYLDANKDQAGEMADKIAGNIKTTGDEAKSALDSSITGYQAKLAGTPPSNGSDLASRAISNPTEFVKNPNDVAALKSFQRGVYSGPESFEAQPEYGDLATKTQAASDLSKGGAEGGRRAMLRALEPNISQGGLDLNDLLVSGVPGAKEKIAGAAAPYKDLRSMLDQNAQSLDAARETSKAGFDAGVAGVKSNFVAPATQNLNDLQGSINQRVQGASTDFNKDQAIKDLMGFMGGAESLSPTERAMFEPEGLDYSGYDTSGLGARAAGVINSSNLGGGFDSQADRGRYASYLLGDDSQLSPGDARRALLDPLKSEIANYSNDPLVKMRASGTPSRQPDWLNRYFAGTNLSSGNPSLATVATPEEAAKILALQQLLEGAPTILNPEDLEKAGTYNPARIARYMPTVGRNPGVPGFSGGVPAFNGGVPAFQP